MIFTTILLLITILFCPGCGDATGKRDRAELETSTAKEAAALVKAGDSAAAVLALQKALEKSPRAARLHLELGIILHESEKDYLGAAYHYRKYLEIRPDSEKSRLIRDRIRVAKQLLAAGVVGVESVSAASIEALEKQNAGLVARNMELEQELRSARAAQRIVVDRPASNAVSGAERRKRPTSGGAFRHYTVQRGDSLSSIAIKVYRDANKWEEIYEANRKELENSNDLKVGQVLIIP